MLNRNVHGGGKRNVNSGMVNGVVANILVDTGADFGMIPRALVHEGTVDCGDKFISGVHGDLVLHKSTTAVFEVAGLCLTKEVIIDDDTDGSLNCILQLDLSNENEVVVECLEVRCSECDYSKAG